MPYCQAFNYHRYRFTIPLHKLALNDFTQATIREGMQ